MQFCSDHWAALRKAVDEAGLGEYVAPSGEELVDRIRLDGFDPLMGAHLALVQHIVRVTPVGAVFIWTMDGCPMCYANEAHKTDCTNCPKPEWSDRWFDQFIPNAVADQRARLDAQLAHDTDGE